MRITQRQRSNGIRQYAGILHARGRGSPWLNQQKVVYQDRRGDIPANEAEPPPRSTGTARPGRRIATRTDRSASPIAGLRRSRRYGYKRRRHEAVTQSVRHECLPVMLHKDDGPWTWLRDEEANHAYLTLNVNVFPCGCSSHTDADDTSLTFGTGRTCANDLHQPRCQLLATRGSALAPAGPSAAGIMPGGRGCPR
jgi:hypothetical protein